MFVHAHTHPYNIQHCSIRFNHSHFGLMGLYSRQRLRQTRALRWLHLPCWAWRICMRRGWGYHERYIYNKLGMSQMFHCFPILRAYGKHLSCMSPSSRKSGLSQVVVPSFMKASRSGCMHCTQGRKDSCLLVSQNPVCAPETDLFSSPKRFRSRVDWRIGKHV
jgi:hypothetical protein